MLSSGKVLSALFGALFVIYVYLIVHCGRKLRTIEARYHT